MVTIWLGPPQRLALAGALLGRRLGWPLATGSPAKHRASGRQALGLLGLRHRLPLLLQRALDASDVVGVE
ncbi:MAG TPA: hypothetical protein VHW23_23340 [Kofleriaceae bacterium]|nr:hypothetical protein [Kofleriaceae bacterium]